MGDEAEWFIEQQINGPWKHPSNLNRMSQSEYILNLLHSLSTATLIQIIDEAGCIIGKGKYAEMQKDVYEKAKAGWSMSDKQRRVLVNIFCQR